MADLKKLYDFASAAETKVQQVAAQINDLFEAGKIEDAMNMKESLDKAKADAKAANELYISMKMATGNEGSSAGDPGAKFVPTGGDKEPQEVTDMRASSAYRDAFFGALRNHVTPKSVKDGIHSAEKYGVLMNAISTTGGDPVGEDGGFLNPVDFDNIIIELMRKFVDMAAYVNVENVTAYSGWRVIEQAAAALPLSAMSELAVLEDSDEGESPKFNKIDYTIVDYGDFLRVSNSQMADTPVNLMAYLARWFSKKVVLTHNSLILAKINALTPTAVTDNTQTLAAIKTVLNKTLDPAFAASANIFTNQSGLELLESLDDGTGRPLLQPDPVNATQLRVKGREVIYLSDAHWANLAAPARARIAIGDGTEFITLFKRQAFEFASTNVGGSSWRSNSSEVRGIARMDVETADSGAMALLAVTL